jgi:hypothetical protein
MGVLLKKITKSFKTPRGLFRCGKSMLPRRKAVVGFFECHDGSPHVKKDASIVAGCHSACALGVVTADHD